MHGSQLQYRNTTTLCSRHGILGYFSRIVKSVRVYHRFYSISSKEFYGVILPEANGCQCWGTSHGWLITIDLNLNLQLLNPISHVQVPLPQHPVSHYWNSLHVPKNLRDMICFKGQLFAIYSEGKFWLCDINSSHPHVKCFAPPPKNVGECDSFYLLELAEELHMVRRNYKTDPTLNALVTEFFEVYRLDVSCKKWIEVNNLDDCALYVGRDTSFFVSASQHPELRRNCIYFTAKSIIERLYYDMRVFDFGNGTIEPFLTDLENRLWFREPIWFKPGLC